MSTAYSRSVHCIYLLLSRCEPPSQVLNPSPIIIARAISQFHKQCKKVEHEISLRLNVSWTVSIRPEFTSSSPKLGSAVTVPTGTYLFIYFVGNSASCAKKFLPKALAF